MSITFSPPSALFVPLDGLTQQESSTGNVRQFTGDGTNYLKVPGLKSLEGIRIGQTEFPLEITHKFRDSTHKDEYVRVTWPMLQLQRDAEGTPILLRSQQSNDGIWQKGAKIFITGEWEDTEAATASEVPEPSKKADKPEKAANTGS